MARAAEGIKARQTLIAAATTAFASRGFPGVSIGDLSKDVGLAKGTVLHHFPTKEKLYNAVLNEVVATLQPLVDALDQYPLADAQILASIADSYLQWALSKPEYAALLTRELLDNAARVRQARHWHLHPFTAKIGGLISRGQAAGHLRIFDPATAVELMLGFVQFHVSAAPTRPYLMGSTKARTYEKKVGKELRAAMTNAFGCS